jgi:hypothetical protein
MKSARSGHFESSHYAECGVISPGGPSASHDISAAKAIAPLQPPAEKRRRASARDPRLAYQAGLVMLEGPKQRPLIHRLPLPSALILIARDSCVSAIVGKGPR